MKTARLAIMCEPDEVRELDDYRWKHRLASRAEAARKLIADGIATEKSGAVGVGAPPRPDQSQELETPEKDHA